MKRQSSLVLWMPTVVAAPELICAQAGGSRVASNLRPHNDSISFARPLKAIRRTR